MELIEERNYCLNCKNKQCSAFGCPLENDIPGFIKANDDKTAFEILCKTTVLPAICGRICPKSRYCQANCIRGIRQEPVEIGKIETYIGDISIKNNYKIPKESSKLKNKKLGGILQYGIPSFRLDKKIVDETINKILELGIKTKTNQELGKDFNIDQLAKEYDAVFISIGTNKQRTILEGRNILSANLLLENIQKNKSFPDFKNKNVLIYGGGNVAIDAARTIKRLGANVSIVYRRNIEQMPAEISEIKDAQNEGIKTIEKTNIIKFKNGKASCIQTRLVEKNDNIEEKLKHKNPIEQKNIKRNNTKVENIEGTNYEIDADYIILAIGSLADVELLKKQGIKIDEHGFIQVDQYNRTSIKKVFAGGDIIGKEATVAYAARSGRETANYITQLLQKNNMDVT